MYMYTYYIAIYLYIDNITSRKKYMKNMIFSLIYLQNTIFVKLMYKRDMFK